MKKIILFSNVLFLTASLMLSCNSTESTNPEMSNSKPAETKKAVEESPIKNDSITTQGEEKEETRETQEKSEPKHKDPIHEKEEANENE